MKQPLVHTKGPMKPHGINRGLRKLNSLAEGLQLADDLDVEFKDVINL